MYRKFALTLLLVIAGTTASLSKGQKKIDPFKHSLEIISLKGKWNFRLDPEKKGIKDRWYTLAQDEEVRLPGTTDENKKGILFETRVGNGKLLVCAVDLLNNQDKPEVRQFLHSIINYADSPDFSPYQELDPDILTEILKTD